MKTIGEFTNTCKDFEHLKYFSSTLAHTADDIDTLWELLLVYRKYGTLDFTQLIKDGILTVAIEDDKPIALQMY